MPQKKAKSRKTTLYKLQGVERLSDLIADKYVADKRFTVDRSVVFGGEPALLVAGQFSAASEAEWCPVVREYVSTDISLHNTTASAALLVKVGEHTLALTYGQGRHFLKSEEIEQNFGLKFSLRCVDPDRIREVTRNVLDERARVDRNTTPQGAAIESFGIEEYGEIVSRIVGEANVALTANAHSGARVAVKGADALFLPVGKSSESLFDDLVEILRVYDSANAREELAFLENLRKVKKQELVYPQLQQELAKSITEATSVRPSLAYPTNAPDDVIEARSFRVRMSGYDTVVEELSLEALTQPLRAMSEGERTLALSRGSVQAFSDEEANDPCSPAIALNRWLACDMTFGNQQFFFHAGSWYEVGTGYADSVDRRVSSILQRDSPISMPSWLNSLPEEGDYNKHAAKVLGFPCLDKTAVKGQLHRRRGIEPCDLLGPDGELIHVKAAERSSPLSHLFNQGRNAAELLLNDPEARDEFRALVIKRGGAPLDDDWRPTRVVFAIASDKDRSTERHLFTFAKVALLRCVESLRGRVEVDVVPIVYESS